MNFLIYSFYKRLFDIFFSLLCLIVISVPVIIIGILIKLFSGGPVFYISNRKGKNDKMFKMLKFRTMKVITPELSSDHFLQPEKYFISFGSFLRKSGLDELPQLINILKGEMSFVGPRPLICDDDELIKLRIKSGVNRLIPGLTGLAQIKGRCRLKASEKFYYDYSYLKNFSFKNDLTIILKTNLFLFNEIFNTKKYLLKFNNLYFFFRVLQENIIKHASILLLYIFYVTV